MIEQEHPPDPRYYDAIQTIAFIEDERLAIESAITSFRSRHSATHHVQIDYSPHFRFKQDETVVRMIAFHSEASAADFQAMKLADHDAFRRSILGDKWNDVRAFEKWLRS